MLGGKKSNNKKVEKLRTIFIKYLSLFTSIKLSNLCFSPQFLVMQANTQLLQPVHKSLWIIILRIWPHP